MRKIVMLLVFGLTACVAEQPATGEKLVSLQNQCKAYGFKAGSDNLNACVFQLDQNRIASNRQKRIAFGEALSDTGYQMQENARTQQLINATNRPLNCTSTPSYGGTVKTSCY